VSYSPFPVGGGRQAGRHACREAVGRM